MGLCVNDFGCGWERVWVGGCVCVCQLVCSVCLFEAVCARNLVCVCLSEVVCIEFAGVCVCVCCSVAVQCSCGIC